MRLAIACLSALSVAAVACAQPVPIASSAELAEPPAFVARLQRLGPVAPFGRPVLISSRVDGGSVYAEIEALVDRPMHDVQLALADPGRWCAALILHINNAGCRSDAPEAVIGAVPHIALRITRRYDQASEQGDELAFSYHKIAATNDRMIVKLTAPRGLLGTYDHGLLLDVAQAGEGRTALKLSYGYRQSALADWGLRLWLGTIGRGKVGFSQEDGANDDGHPVAGVRGLLERNLVLYLIAIEAAARTPTVVDRQGFHQRLRDYFDATERFPRQLREVGFDTYLALKWPLIGVGSTRDLGP